MTNLHLVLIIRLGNLFNGNVLILEFLLKHGARCPTAQEAIVPVFMAKVALGDVLVLDAVDLDSAQTGQGDTVVMEAQAEPGTACTVAPVRV